MYNIGMLIASFILFIVLSPGVLLMIPKKASKMTRALVHAVVFFILLFLFRNFMKYYVTEGITSIPDPKKSSKIKQELLTKSSRDIQKVSKKKGQPTPPNRNDPKYAFTAFYNAVLSDAGHRLHSKHVNDVKKTYNSIMNDPKSVIGRDIQTCKDAEIACRSLYRMSLTYDDSEDKDNTVIYNSYYDEDDTIKAYFKCPCNLRKCVDSKALERARKNQ